MKTKKKICPQMYRNNSEMDREVDGAGFLRFVQDLSSYYAKCHETPFCMRDRLISRMRKLEGGEKKGEEKGGDLEFII